MTYLRFGIRDLLWAMVMVAMALGWWVDRGNSHEKYEELRRWTWSKVHSRRLTMTRLEFELRFGDPDQ